MTALWALPLIAADLAGTSAAATAVEPPIVPQSPNIEAIAPNLSDPSTEVLALEEERNDRYLVPVMIGSAGPFNFMIDTGSQATAVTQQINEGLGLPQTGTATLVGMASRRPVNLVEVEEMSFGSHTVYDLLSPVLDRRNVGADGILGLDSLQDFRVLIDFREETIAVQDVSQIDNYRSGFEIIVRARQELGQLLITDAVVEGVKATVIIDTGAQASIGNLALQERIRTNRAEQVTTTDVNGVEMTGDLSVVRSLTIEGLTVTNVPLAFADAPAFEALGINDRPVIALGMQHLKIFDRIAIDFTRQRILFDVPRDVARSLRRSRGSNLRPNGF